MPGRRNGNIDRVRTVPDEFIRRVTEAALLIDDPAMQIKTLNSIPGTGPATATVILAFYDPENYGIGDRFLLDELFGEDRNLRVTDYPKILAELHDQNPGEFDLRTVDIDFYQKYRVDNDKGNWSRHTPS